MKKAKRTVTVWLERDSLWGSIRVYGKKRSRDYLTSFCGKGFERATRMRIPSGERVAAKVSLV